MVGVIFDNIIVDRIALNAALRQCFNVDIRHDYASLRYAAWACWLTPFWASSESVSSVFFSSASVASSNLTA
jgi:hypothetical protein